MIREFPQLITRAQWWAWIQSKLASPGAIGTTTPAEGKFTKVTASKGLSRGYPIGKSADFTVGETENWITINRAATTTVTLPNAADFVGREIMFRTVQAQTLVSASANVYPLAGGAAGTAILSATAGKWATLVSDGTNWVTTQGN